MSMNKAYEQYKENSIYTASPEDLTLMLYNGLVKFLMQAEAAIEEKNVEKSHASIIRAEDIIQEFMSTLDMNYEVSNNLVLLYDYMYRRLIQANTEKNKDIVTEVLGFARELRDTWAQAMKIAKNQMGKTQQIAK